MHAKTGLFLGNIITVKSCLLEWCTFKPLSCFKRLKLLENNHAICKNDFMLLMFVTNLRLPSIQDINFSFVHASMLKGEQAVLIWDQTRNN